VIVAFLDRRNRLGRRALLSALFMIEDFLMLSVAALEGFI
jgi:hypothetical protein